MKTLTFPRLLMLTGSLVMLGCGSSGSGGGNPLAPDSGSPGPSGATITIGTDGTVSPKTVTIAVGQSVTFQNNDVRSHDMTSNPHPTHTDCPAINVVGVLVPGQSRVTNALSKAVTCGYHDHNDPNNTSMQGSIVIQ